MFGIDAGHLGVLFGVQSRQPNPCWRNDAVFVQKLTWLIKLRDFIDREPIEIKPGDQDKLNFGADNSLIYNHRGTDVSTADWGLLEERTRVLMSYMTPDLLRRFELRLAPKALFWLPIILATVAAVALGMSVFPPHTSLWGLLGFLSNAPAAPPESGHLQSWRLSGFLFWGISVGAIGAVSFLYVNALSIQIDKNVDITNKNFITMRIILGALFGVVLDLPLGYPGFAKFCDSLAKYEPSVSSSSQIDVAGAALLLLPFLIGFSAPLMISILNRLVDAIQNLFGIKNDIAKPSQAGGSI